MAIANITLAACPELLSGSYGGLVHNFSFSTSDVFNEKEVGVSRINLDGSGNAEFLALYKSSANSQGQMLVKAGRYTFNRATCDGVFTINGDTDLFRFVVLNSGAELNMILYTLDNPSDHDAWHAVFKRI